MQSWVRVDGCPAAASTQRRTSTSSTVSRLAAEASVLYYEIVGGTHRWFDQPSATQLAWAFLLRQAKNG